MSLNFDGLCTPLYYWVMGKVFTLFTLLGAVKLWVLWFYSNNLKILLRIKYECLFH